jgi:hypothetical protein
VPNPSTNPVHRIRSHNYLHLQDSNSLERGDESYHSNMFNFDENGKNVDSNSHNSRSRESYDNILK